MSAGVLILRPRPGADETAARARALGLAPAVAPLFTVRPLAWQPPPGSFDAVMLTSAHAARLAGDGLTPLLSSPCYAVGEATARAARDAGFARIVTGPSDGDALVARMAADGAGSALWLAGADRTMLKEAGVRIAAVAVYAADPVAALPPEAGAALRDGALALLHSARAAALFAKLAAHFRPTIRIAALSGKVAGAAGAGWAEVAVADRPRDEALLELAAKLCQTGGAMRRPHA